MTIQTCTLNYLRVAFVNCSIPAICRVFLSKIDISIPHRVSSCAVCLALEDRLVIPPANN